MGMHDLFEKRNEFYILPSQNVKGGLVAGLLLGVVALVAAFFTVEPARIWSAVLLNTFFFFSIALGGIVFSGIQDVIGALWARPIKRIHEGFAAFLPAAAAVLMFFLICIYFDILGARSVYVWMKNPEMIEHFDGKNVWLVPGFMVVRDVVALVLILVLSMWQLNTSVKRDVAFARGDKAAAQTLSVDALNKLRYWCAPILFAYALLYSLLAFDLLMSLEPLWFSTLWAAWTFAIMMQTLMATLLLFMFSLKDSSLGRMIERKHFHDVGKLMHGFTIFFAYLTYAHVLTYWYGNVPEETEYFIERIHGPWLWIVMIAPFFNFVIPLYTLVFKAAKWTAPVTITLALMILIAQWFVYVLVVVPSVSGHNWVAGWVDAGVLALSVSTFLACFFAFSKRVPMLGIADALLPEALEGHH